MGFASEDFDKLKMFLNKTTKKGDEDFKDKAYECCVKADALRIRNYFLESVEEYRHSIKYRKNNPEAYKGLGISYKSLGDMKSAIENLEKARKLGPFDKETYYELGLCYIKEGKGCPAIKSFIKAVKIDHEFFDALFHMAVAHEMIDELEMAEMIYLQIIESRPSYISAYNSLGSLYIRKQNYVEAIRNFKVLIEINPEFARAYLGIGVAFDKMDKLSEAKRYYKKYLELKPNSTSSSYINERLDSIRAEKTDARPSHLKLVSVNKDFGAATLASILK